MSAYDPLADVDVAALAEAQARLTEALEAVGAAIDAGKHVQARRDLEALEASAAAEAEAVPDPEASGADGPPTLDSLRKRLNEADPVGAAGIRPLAAMAGDLPRPVLWMDSRRGGGTVLRAGDVAALGGAGGVGKSFATLALAVAAAEPGDGPGDAVGLHVRRGPAVLIGYEDDPATVAWRVGLIAARSGPIPDPAPDALHLVPDPDPLMTADPDRPGAAAEAPGWQTLWRGVRKLAPSLVIVDPASAALADANQNDGATVRRFIRALAREAERGGWGVLLVAHSTKAARYGGDPGPRRNRRKRAMVGRLPGRPAHARRRSRPGRGRMPQGQSRAARMGRHPRSRLAHADRRSGPVRGLATLRTLRPPGMGRRTAMADGCGLCPHDRLPGSGTRTDDKRPNGQEAGTGSVRETGRRWGD